MSIGLPWLQAAGRNASRASSVDGERWASSPRLSINASVARTPGPPALVTIASLRPARPGLLGQHLGHVEDLRDRIDPQHADAPERGVEHLVAAGQGEPVCDAAALAAASVRPALITMIGLVSATSRAADRNERASPIDSM